MQDIKTQIRRLESKAEEVRLRSRLNRISVLDAKNQLREIDIRLEEMLKKLPKYERDLYKIKKEHGNVESGLSF